MVAYKVADMEVNMMADMVVDMVADMEVNMVADLVADMEVDMVADMRWTRWPTWWPPKFQLSQTFLAEAHLGLRNFLALRVYSKWAKNESGFQGDFPQDFGEYLGGRCF